MARIVLVTGGCRSGKSQYALKAAENENSNSTCIFVATCPNVDPEMNERILKHKKTRNPAIWETIEEETKLVELFKKLKEKVVLVDCISLWVNNLMYEAQMQKRKIREFDLLKRCTQMLDAVGKIRGHVYFVSNEVGLGIVPETKDSRLYRDLLGQCNQSIAKRADKVVFMVSGIPIVLK